MLGRVKYGPLRPRCDLPIDGSAPPARCDDDAVGPAGRVRKSWRFDRRSIVLTAGSINLTPKFADGAAKDETVTLPCVSRCIFCAAAIRSPR